MSIEKKVDNILEFLFLKKVGETVREEFYPESDELIRNILKKIEELESEEEGYGMSLSKLDVWDIISNFIDDLSGDNEEVIRDVLNLVSPDKNYNVNANYPRRYIRTIKSLNDVYNNRPAGREVARSVLETITKCPEMARYDGTPHEFVAREIKRGTISSKKDISEFVTGIIDNVSLYSALYTLTETGKPIDELIGTKKGWGVIDNACSRMTRGDVSIFDLCIRIVGNNHDMVMSMVAAASQGTTRNDFSRIISNVDWPSIGISKETYEEIYNSIQVDAEVYRDIYNHRGLFNERVFFSFFEKVMEIDKKISTPAASSTTKRRINEVKETLAREIKKYPNYKKYVNEIEGIARKEIGNKRYRDLLENLFDPEKRVDRECIREAFKNKLSNKVIFYSALLYRCKKEYYKEEFYDILSEYVYKKSKKDFSRMGLVIPIHPPTDSSESSFTEDMPTRIDIVFLNVPYFADITGFDSYTRHIFMYRVVGDSEIRRISPTKLYSAVESHYSHSPELECFKRLTSYEKIGTKVGMEYWLNLMTLNRGSVPFEGKMRGENMIGHINEYLKEASYMNILDTDL